MDDTRETKGDAHHAEETTAEGVVADDAVGTAGVSRTTLVVSVLVALVVAGTAGFVIGWKLEQERVKDDLANIRPIGTVTAVDDDSVTIELETADGTKTYRITERTTVGGTGNLEEGATILIRSSRGDGDQLQADQIFVLVDPASADS